MNFEEPLVILVVEDNELNQRLIEISLERYNHTVVLVKNGLEALQQVKERHFDLVIMDLMMPVMDGIEATKQIRLFEQEHPEAGHVKIIAFTANTITFDRTKCHQIGMDDILEKPFDLNNLKMIIQNLI